MALLQQYDAKMHMGWTKIGLERQGLAEVLLSPVHVLDLYR
jgi:hypothetical protein